ncbi:hemerythrin domain-containing protein [Streptomyces sp. NPDC001523]|uniref:hemerythrin domain-containing protein n=1 Tax=Streptomyces sp. NPDC001523 TaxID=3154383 RepID=UPI00332DDD06
MSPSTTSERPHTHEMVVVHRVFRRESALLPRLVRAVPDGETTRATGIATHVAEYLTGLHHHHTVEDETIWPLLRERAADEEPIARMEEQHARIDRGLAAVTDRLPGWLRTADREAGEDLALALDEHHSALLEHLDDEERMILPLVADHLTVTEWDAVGRRGLETVPRNKLMIALGALLEDATPGEQAHFLGRTPLIGRLLWKTIGRRQYAASRRALRAPLDGGTGR